MSDSKRYSTLVNNTILFAISNFGSKIISLIIQPYLSYALASPDVMGVTSLLQSVGKQPADSGGQPGRQLCGDPVWPGPQGG